MNIHVTGIVQGVGFRPFVYRLAKRYLVNGWVLNAIDGVHIHAEGDGTLLDEFILEISENAPAAAQVKQIDIKEVPLEDFKSFEIRFSDESNTKQTTLVSPDLATCDDCVCELFDPRNRRYRYPFINCTNCGPRFTIIQQLPYDRPATSMGEFPMCDECAHEYADPHNRRFHAQPDACFECGPSLCFAVLVNDEPVRWQWGKTRQESDAIVERVVAMLRDGSIVAVKGLGGFHLVCDASNPQALCELRQRKRRPGKAFAVMMRDVEQVRRYCHVSIEEEALLTSPARPIVLLRRRTDACIEEGVICGLPELGVMLPATPVQHLIAHAFDGMLVMTSGNVHDEPIQIDDQQACMALAHIADAVLGNNRAILNRYDDSVVRVLDVGEGFTIIQAIRRARGYAPLPLHSTVLANDDQAILAVGAEQKNTFCLTRGNEAFVSQHIGDMEDACVQDAWFASLSTYERLFEVKPHMLACDMHPEYLASKWAHDQRLPLVEVQHHHAHIASVIAENSIEDPVCGFAFDGTGYGADGAIWGGEVLLARVQAFERFANFVYVPLPSGAAAIAHPQRCAYGVLWAFDLLDHPGASDLLVSLGDAASMCHQMIDQSINCPHTSSVGRLFDAASALLGVCTQSSYEGEPAILLEAALLPSTISESSGGEDVHVYEVDIIKNVATQASTAQDTSVVLLDPAPVFRALLDDKAAGVPIPVIAQRFHNAFVDVIVRIAQLVQAVHYISTVALSGGVFMNRYLVEHAVAALSDAGFTVALNKELPPNDGCISFGQAVVAASNAGAVSVHE